MKKILFVLLSIGLFGANLQAQNTPNKSIYVYGVDFSTVKTYAANETPEQFATAFTAINQLLLSEPDKYDFSRLFDQAVEVTVDPMIAHNAKRDLSTLHTESQLVTPLSIEEVVRAYDLPQSEGTGFVAIARLLNKAAGKATYDLVVFDIATRKVLYNAPTETKAGGFGLRNYWANTVYRLTKGNKIYFDR